MKCEICHNADAEVAIHRTIDGEDRELYVCKNCAKEPGKDSAAPDSAPGAEDGDPASGKGAKRRKKQEKTLLGGLQLELPKEFLSGLLKEMLESGIQAAHTLENPTSPPPGHPCPECGMTSVDFRREQRLGCPACYEHLADAVTPAIHDMQSGTSHVGKVPASAKADGAGASQRRKGPSAAEIRRVFGTLLDPVPDPREEFGSIVLSSRIRLARNLAGERFPDWSDPDALSRIFLKVANAAEAAGSALGLRLLAVDIAKYNGSDVIQSLCESNVISQTLLDRGAGAGFLIPAECKTDIHVPFSLMVNEEDHVRLQVVRLDEDLMAAWRTADLFDSELEKHLSFSFGKRLGYLTACPSNLGTGLRASVMLALPGLYLLGDFDAVCRAIDRLGYNTRGRNGEGTNSTGGVVQISSRGTLGFTEAEVITGLLQIVDEVVRCERQARRHLLRREPAVLHDHIARALALLRNARLLNSDETYAALMAVRLGHELGLVRRVSMDMINELLRATSPAHTQHMMATTKMPPAAIESPDGRDIFRANLVRDSLRRATLAF